MEDARELFYQSRPVVFSPDHNDVTYREALKKLEKAVSLEPDNGTFITRLGAAQYRVGAYEDALATLARTKKLMKVAGWEPGPVVNGFRVLALHQLGRDTEANAVIQ